MSIVTIRHSHRGPARALQILWASLAIVPLGTAWPQAGDERFQSVKDWFGRLEITVSGDGSLPAAQGSTTYQVRRHLAYTFHLEPTFGFEEGLSHNWTTCNTATSLGTIRDELFSRIEGRDKDCELTVRREASGTLDPIPPEFNCVINGFQLQIIPLTSTETFTSWGFAGGIQGTQTTIDSCAETTFTGDMGLGFLEVGNPAICNGTSCLKLPLEGFKVLNTWSFDQSVSIAGSESSAHFEVVLELEACGNEPDLIVEVEDYANWRPRGSESEIEEGNVLRLKAVLKSKGGCPTELKARRFTFEVLEASSEPGICMNYPLFLPPRVPTGLPDLGFLVKNNPDPWLSSGDPSFILESEDGEYSESPAAILSSFDWGGHAKIRVTAELLDGRMVVGHLAGDEAVKEIPIPRRRAGSKIADGWREANGTGDLPDEDDGEALPIGDGHQGDGLTLYEEYRGFYQGRSRDHTEANPKNKDLFLVDEAAAQGGIKLFARATGFEVHGRLTLGQLDPRRVVNFNRGADVAGAIDQHGLYLFRRELGKGIAGRAEGGPGLPKQVKLISIGRKQNPKFVFAMVQGQLINVTNELQTIAHEILHGCNVYHHGRTDRRSASWGVEARGDKFVYVEGGNVVSVFLEGGCGQFEAITPADLQATWKDIYIGREKGEHSGNEDCLMRYTCATVYEDHVLADVYWVFSREETPGFLLCGSACGNGNNAASHCPQSRYGNATLGSCQRQICVNDRKDHEAFQPTPCAGGGGGETMEDPAGGHGGGAEVEASPVVSLAIEEEIAPAVVRGEPILVSFSVLSSRFGASEPGEALILAPGTDAWSSAITIRVSKDGSELPVSLVPLGPVPAELRLDETTSGLAAWWIPPAASALIEPGVYTVDAQLDTASAPEGWQGIIEAVPVTLTVVEEPSPLPPDDAARSTLVFARYRAWEGRLAEALSLLDEDIAGGAGAAEAHWFRAQILDHQGDKSAALDAIQRAIDLIELDAEDDDEPPTELLRERDALLAEVRQSGSPGSFRRGDANADGTANISDAIFTLGWQFLGAPAPPCIDAADANDDGAVDLSDAVALLAYLYLGGPAPPAPGSEACGSDQTPDALEPCTPPCT